LCGFCIRKSLYIFIYIYLYALFLIQTVTNMQEKSCIQMLMHLTCLSTIIFEKQPDALLCISPNLTASGREAAASQRSSERAAEDVDPAAGTSSGRDARVQSAVPRPVDPHAHFPAPMKPPPMKPRAARVRRKVARDREHVLARRVCLDAVVCGRS